ncbi:hypothetical protein [Vibrio neptunius]|uniref:hypothetical protein n=1 Tax=Vibrio neptunius TaxID=170651 RepID=UPI003B97B25B
MTVLIGVITLTNKKYLTLWALLSYSSFCSASADEGTDDVVDMSDPMAIYSQAGAGLSNKGLNLKIGNTYNTGSDTQLGMNIIELKGVLGEAVGWDGSSVRDDSIDSLRLRNFTVDTTNGRGTQIDININAATDSGSASYGFIQALPEIGPFKLYPLAGLGVSIESDDEMGYLIPGTYGLVGMYGKFEISDKLWLNYNPFWLSTLSGSDTYKETGMQGSDTVFTHELAVSYQFTPRFNVRAFANWSDNVNFSDGNHRLEFNYQF